MKIIKLKEHFWELRWKVKNETWVVGKTRLEEFMTEVKIEDYKIERTFLGTEMEGKK